MDYTKRSNQPHQPDPVQTRQLMTGIGETVSGAERTGARRQAQIDADKMKSQFATEDPTKLVAIGPLDC